jgi:hypothetical protein
MAQNRLDFFVVHAQSMKVCSKAAAESVPAGKIGKSGCASNFPLKRLKPITSELPEALRGAALPRK